jgi:hypothetical protein
VVRQFESEVPKLGSSTKTLLIVVFATVDACQKLKCFPGNLILRLSSCDIELECKILILYDIVCYAIKMRLKFGALKVFVFE